MLTRSILVTLFLSGSYCLGQDVGFVQVTEGAADHRYPAWSPREGYLAFESMRDGNWELYLLKLEDRSIARVTDEPGDDRYPAWDPDGTRLVFHSTRTGEPELHVLDVRSRETSILAHIDGEELVPDWSPDGRRIAMTMAIDSVLQIVILNSDGSSEVLDESPFRSVWPRWSPDGDRLTFFSRRDTGGEDDEVYVFDAAASTLRRLTDRQGHDFCPTWSPDGKFIAAAGIESDGSRTLRIIPVAGGPPRVLRTSFYRLTEPDWSPDGKFIAVAAKPTEEDAYHIFVVAMEE